MAVKGLKKVVWSEGVFLGPQHFQQWEEYGEACRQLQGRALNPLAWGMLSLVLDEKGLESGRFLVQECTAILPGGQLVSHDGAVDVPLQVDLGGRGGETLEVFLALPANCHVEGINGYPRPGRLSAWRADYRQVADAYDPQREREVLLAGANLMILTGDQPREGFSVLKIAEVVNEGDGSFRLLGEYIPPLVRVGASPSLRGMVGRMVEIISARVRALSERMRQGNGGPAEFAQREPTNLLLLQALNVASPLLAHYQGNPDLHPEGLYRTLCSLVGTLCSFSPVLDVGIIPPYQHEAPSAVFPPLERALGNLMNVAGLSRPSALKLVKETEALLCVAGIEEKTLRECTFFLEVLVDAEDPSWVADFARQVKVSSRGTIEMVVASALPGVRMTHTQRPPARLATKSGFEYFRLEPRGDFWGRIVEEATLALFLPQHFTSGTIELVTIQE
jgi:type VI secretion system protein ImpJ